MSYLPKIWRWAPISLKLQQQLCSVLAIPPVVANLLINRGITNPDEARHFLFGGFQDLHDPFFLKDMEKAVNRIQQAIDGQEKIMIYGDYDVDGITASAIMFLVLTRLGAQVEYYIPERESEGYGLHHGALMDMYASGTSLVITVDCGISATKEIEQSMMDIIITDHHQPPEQLPPAYAIINPKRKDCLYPDKKLAGVGVAFKLCQALGQAYQLSEDELKNYLDIVALGTIADIVSLVGENHIIVKLGLEKMNRTDRPGILALLEVCGVTKCDIGTGQVGFMLAPRLNAAGRISSATTGVELLVTKDLKRAAELAQLLNEENGKRQVIEREILACAEEQLLVGEALSQQVLVVEGLDWHSGVIGIVASRLVDKYYRPVIMISVKNGIGKGSCRSISGFNMYEALRQCEDLLIKFGGHEQAAGLTIQEENIAVLRERLNEFAKKTLIAEDYIPKIHIEELVALEEVNEALMEQIAILEPFGMGNPSPVFACKNITVVEKKIMSQGKHLKLKVKKEQARGSVIAWNMGVLASKIQLQEEVDLAFSLNYNDWLGIRQLQLQAKDIKCSPITMIDYRNCSNREQLMVEIANRGETLVYVGTAEQKQQVSTLLPSGSLCQCLWSEEKTEGKFQNIIIGALDKSWESLAHHCRFVAGSEGGNIYLLYGRQDRKSLEELLQKTAPGRREVGTVYLISKKMNSKDLTLQKIVDQVQEQCPYFSLTMIQLCLDIMIEIGVMVVTDNRYQLTEPIEGKRDIMLSSTFRKGNDVRNICNSFVQEALETPLFVFSNSLKQRINH